MDAAEPVRARRGDHAGGGGATAGPPVGDPRRDAARPPPGLGHAVRWQLRAAPAGGGRDGPRGGGHPPDPHGPDPSAAGRRVRSRSASERSPEDVGRSSLDRLKELTSTTLADGEAVERHASYPAPSGPYRRRVLAKKRCNPSSEGVTSAAGIAAEAPSGVNLGTIGYEEPDDVRVQRSSNGCKRAALSSLLAPCRRHGSHRLEPR